MYPRILALSVSCPTHVNHQCLSLSLFFNNKLQSKPHLWRQSANFHSFLIWIRPAQPHFLQCQKPRRQMKEFRRNALSLVSASVLFHLQHQGSRDSLNFESRTFIFPHPHSYLYAFISARQALIFPKYILRFFYHFQSLAEKLHFALQRHQIYNLFYA